MFIDPNSIDSYTLNTLIRDFAYTQMSVNSNGNTDMITDEALDVFKRKLLAKECVIHFASNDDIEDDARISIRAASDFSLSPSQIEF